MYILRFRTHVLHFRISVLRLRTEQVSVAGSATIAARPRPMMLGAVPIALRTRAINSPMFGSTHGVNPHNGRNEGWVSLTFCRIRGVNPHSSKDGEDLFPTFDCCHDRNCHNCRKCGGLLHTVRNVRGQWRTESAKVYSLGQRPRNHPYISNARCRRKSSASRAPRTCSDGRGDACFI